LVLHWIESIGGLAGILERNFRKSETIYDAIDESGGFYRGHAAAESRSLMNVTWRLPDESLEKQFITEALAAGMIGLAGHRSVGGIRASIYNAMGVEGCQTLASFMNDFASRNG
jgi:phosphoserine aminotransferase